MTKIPDDKLPAGAQFGYDLSTFMVNVQAYLLWLQVQVWKAGIDVRREYYDDIRELFEDFPSTMAIFNCTGLGSYSLKGVEDHAVYPTRVGMSLSLLSVPGWPSHAG
ncbi:hypothetical protein A1O1_01418 [Capronia coronata CBS 617.96]|uniref:Uncharacterized protein n=1 Tax=Capronia coronata CBS 617.96 TaxID=1182541 RepID=W9YTQ5_9EURO|nr:uncharacterized protein A1O1_01418 [Capronia coronata CBS 617.96]EXJ96292.1 hypothetical protein A1O1_01418 [Capronia coronata CBS 617.96]